MRISSACCATRSRMRRTTSMRARWPKRASTRSGCWKRRARRSRPTPPCWHRKRGQPSTRASATWKGHCKAPITARSGRPWTRSTTPPKTSPRGAWTKASAARSPASRSARSDAEVEGAAGPRHLPAGRGDRRRARQIDLRHAARAPHRHRARVREAGGVHHLPRDPAPGLRFARAARREGRGHARQGVGSGGDLAALLPGENRRRGSRDRDPEIHHQLRARRRRQEGVNANMKWTDTQAIAIALTEAHPDVDPEQVRFTDLYQWVLALPGFSDDPKRCGEKILEAIQMAWIDEAE